MCQSLQLYLKRDSGTCASREFCEISKNSFSCKTSPLAASVAVLSVANNTAELFCYRYFPKEKIFFLLFAFK